MTKRAILYIGNDLVKKTNYNTSMNVLTKLLQNENIKVYRASSKQNKVLRIIDMLFTVFKRKRDVDYVIVDTFSTSNFYFALAVSQLCRVLKLKYIPVLRGGNLPHRIDNSSFFSNLIFKNSFKNIAPSNYLKTEFEHRGYETSFITNILQIENYDFKQRENLEPKILWVRAFRKLYNPMMAIKVLNCLKKDYPNAELCMVGPHTDSSHGECLDLVKKYNLEDSITFTGVLPKEEWHKLSVSYDIFINTTNFDNTPVSVMEAMALGLSVVSTNAGGMPFLIDDKEDGVLVDKNDYKKMSEEISSLIKNNNLNYIKKARFKAESFGWNNVRKFWLEILNYE